MAKPPLERRTRFTRAEIDESDRQFVRADDRLLWNRLARLLGVRGRDLAAAFGRLIEGHLDRLLPRGPFVCELRLPAASRLPALKTLIFELIADDIAETFAILSQGTPNDTGNPEEIAGCSEPSAAEHERPMEAGEDQEGEDAGGDARE